MYSGICNRLSLILHQPNSPAGAERAKIFKLKDCGDTLVLDNN